MPKDVGERFTKRRSCADPGKKNSVGNGSGGESLESTSWTRSGGEKNRSSYLKSGVVAGPCVVFEEKSKADHIDRGEEIQIPIGSTKGGNKGKKDPISGPRKTRFNLGLR